ncbi:hypothetical protein [Paraburkholderia sp. JHI869]|uniref:hypothetical protein n=1 Tax=Paraburkholderia sp. JHI869 TaxID=3112959 RepID=UPI0031816C76
MQDILSQQADTMQAAQAAGQVVAQGIGAYADSKQKAAQDAADAATNAAQTETDPNVRAADLALAQQEQAEADSWAEGGANRVGLHVAGGALIAGLGGGGVTSAVQGAAGAGLAAYIAPKLNTLADEFGEPGTAGHVLGNVIGNVLATAAGAAVGGSAGASTASNADLYNRQLHPDERQWAKDNAAAFAKYYEAQTGQSITPDQALALLLGSGLRIVDSSAANVPGGNPVATSYISANAPSSLFYATPTERSNPFLGANPSGSPTPEQNALTYSVGSTGTFTIQIGVNAGLHVFDLGGTGETGLAVSLGAHPNFCAYAQGCATMGLGFTASTGVAITVGQGAASTGVTSSTGGFIAGGDGLFADTNLTRDGDGNLAAGKGVLGLGVGGAAGAQQCKQATACLVKDAQ